jgi:hypothetical protein
VTGRRVGAAVLAAIALAALLVALGRWERGRRAEEQISGMRRVLAAVGPLDSPTLKAFRYLTSFQCLLYERNGNPVALELCVDPEGRLVEAIDRRAGDPEIASLRDDPTRSTIRLDRDEVDRLLMLQGVPRRLIEEAHGRAST